MAMGKGTEWPRLTAQRMFRSLPLTAELEPQSALEFDSVKMSPQVVSGARRSRQVCASQSVYLCVQQFGWQCDCEYQNPFLDEVEHSFYKPLALVLALANMSACWSRLGFQSAQDRTWG